MLHGLTFAVLWSASVTHAQALAPPGRAGLFQGLVEAMHWGVGFGCGAGAGGLLFERVGAVRTFQGAAAVAAAMCAACLGLRADKRARARDAARATRRGFARLESEACDDDDAPGLELEKRAPEKVPASAQFSIE